MKFNKEKIKQIVLSVIAFSLIIVGYLNYDYNQNRSLEVSVESRNEVNLGDVQLVNSEPEKIVPNGVIVSNNELEKEKVKEEIQKEDIDNYFEETRIQRDRMYSEMLETYQKLVDSVETPNDQKSIAAQEISNITSIKNGIMISENLIKNKGFDNVIILVNNGKVSVVVKSEKLASEQISQIQNIVQRELNIEISNISISNK